MKRLSASLAADDALLAFFDMVDGPAALCDEEGIVHLANPAFEVLCGTRAVEGKALRGFFPEAPTIPEEGRAEDCEVVSPSGQGVTMTLLRRGQAVAVVARGAVAGDTLAAAGRALVEHAHVEQALLELGRQVAGVTGEEELVAAVARGVKGLFPGRTFCIRITDPRTCTLTSLYAEGRLLTGTRDALVLRQSAVEKTHLDPKRLRENKVQVVPGEPPLLFEGSTRGLSAPLVTSGQLYGAVNVEYPKGVLADLVADERILIQLANQVSVAVKNAKLIDELTFVRTYLEDLLEHANALIFVANRDRRIIVFNRLLAELTGYSRSEVLGQDWLELAPESEKLQVMRVVAAAAKGESVAAFETALKAKNGREVRLTFSTAPAMAQSGEVEGVIAIGQDLTRTRDLEKRVVHAEKLASLGQLAASVAHEINNPMTSVVAYTDALLARTSEGPDADKYRKILDNSERVLRFTKDLVSYARPAPDKPETVDLNAVVHKAVSLCDHVVSKHGLEVKTQYAELPMLLGSPHNLMQVFVNLVTNACHATPMGGTLTVKTFREAEAAVVTVSDTGQGIGPDVITRIFEPFFTTKPDGRGTGLGLSIVQGIVDRHGGSITVESKPGQGTVFFVRLPILSES